MNQNHYERSSLALKVTEHVSAMLAYWDKDLVCRFANAPYRAWFGKTQDEMLGKVNIRELLGPHFEQTLPFVEGALSGKIQTFEREITMPDGNVKHFLGNYFPEIEEGEVLGFFVQITDVTPVKKLEQELKRSNKELSNFAHVVSHDLKSPLRGIASVSKWLEKDYADKLEGEGKEMLDLLTARVRTMETLIDGILNYSRVGFDQQSPVKVDTAELIRDIITSIHVPQHFKVEVKGDFPVIFMDETRLRQVFQNLINNSIKYNDKMVGLVEVGVEDDQNFWKFYVRDNGIGIDEKNYSKIFEIFQTFSSGGKKNSSGIGLSIVKKIVEDDGGKIWLESETGKGTTFFFTLKK